MSSRATAPQLTFDDGSRAMREHAVDDGAQPLECPRGSLSLQEFYQLDALVAQLRAQATSHTAQQDRIALQFPDELLQDAPEICQVLQESLGDSLVFVLGDTTFAPCCPDTIAAQHLSANLLVHFGHACLSQSVTVKHISNDTANVGGLTRILYCFGNYSLDVHDCVEQVTGHMVESNGPRRVILLYDTAFYHTLEELQTRLGEQGDMLVVAGQMQLPEHRQVQIETCSRSDCCATSMGGSSSLNHEKDSEKPLSHKNDIYGMPEVDEGPDKDTFLVGGLEIPAGLDMASFTLLYIGDPESRQFLNIAMRLLSSNPQPSQFWTYHPSKRLLATSLEESFSRRLNRRFFLVNKARQVSTFGILVSSLADPRMQRAVEQLQKVLDVCGRTCYTVCVGKINPAKLANFAEIQCYVLLACPDHALLDNENEFSTMVLTPFELLMSLGIVNWGDRPYSVHIEDCMQIIEEYLTMTNDDQHETQPDEESDEPYFNVATGRYESAPPKKDEGIDLKALPGRGQLTAYKSTAAEFLKQREYQGLQVKRGETDVRAAIPGQQGIPANYGDR